MILLYFLLSDVFSPQFVNAAPDAISAQGTVNDVSFKNFVHLEGHKLLVQSPLKTLKLGSFLACLFECNGEERCLSTNVNKTRDFHGRIECVLLDFDMYQHGQNLTKVDEFDHYALTSECASNPCKHNGKCIPLYSTNNYHCECLEGTKGNRCQEQDFRSCAQRFAAGYNDSGVHKIKAPDNTTLDVYCSYSNGDGWTMVFKSVSGEPLTQAGPSELWKSNSVLESSLSEGRHHYKNRIVDQWNAFKPNKVRLSLYTKKTEVVRLVFNGTVSTKMNWFSFERLTSSPWTDISSEPRNFFSITGDIRDILRRTFFINRSYNGCDEDRGWMVLYEKKACPYESALSQFSILYSPGSTFSLYKSIDQSKGVADTMIIYLQ